MGKNEKRAEIELRSGSLLRVREYFFLPEEATHYPLDIAILELDRSQNDAIIHLRGKTMRKRMNLKRRLFVISAIAFGPVFFGHCIRYSRA